MAQLSDDCFAFGGRLQTLDAALATIAGGVPCVAGAEPVPLWDADGRILAADVVAPADLPPFTNSAVDGYAVRLAEAASPLPIAGRLAAGAAAAPLPPASTIRIFTGAPLPPGADTVFMQEDVREQGGVVSFPSGLQLGANTRPAGEDVAAGAVAMPAGRVLRPQDIALTAALGLATVPVRRRIRVALFSTGNELVDPPGPLGLAQRWDSNRVLLALLCRRAGARVTDFGILPDRRDAIADALAAAAGHDLILTSGGVSTGEQDHVRDAVEQAGRLVFWRIAIKPGRPVAMGQVGDALFLGLPGNPVAAFVTFVRIARPVLAALGGASPAFLPALPVQIGFDYRKKPGRREYIRVRLDQSHVAQRHHVEGAGVLMSLTEADGLIEVEDDRTRLETGAVAGFMPFLGLL